MKPRVALTAALLLALAFLIAPSAARAENLDITPAEYDFGDVEVGTSADATFDLVSLGPSEVWVYLIQVSADGTAAAICGEDVECDYSITRITGPVPSAMPPGSSMEVDVTYAPSTEGPSAAYLYVSSNDSVDPPGPEAFIPLSGTGVVTPPPDDAAALMDALLEAFDAAVDAGEIEGIGPGRSASHRLAAFRAHLVAANWLIDDGAGEYACVPLAAAYAKADGERRPPDFVDGPGVDEVLALIQGVMDALGCGAGHGVCHR